jgi:hypothetical protein
VDTEVAEEVRREAIIVVVGIEEGDEVVPEGGVEAGVARERLDGYLESGVWAGEARGSLA